MRSSATFGPTELSRQREPEDLGRGRIQAGQGPLLLGHAAGAGERAGHRADAGIVSGSWSNYYLNGRTGGLNPVTIDARTLTRTTTCSTITAAPTSCGCAAAFNGTSPTTSRSGARSTAMTPTATGSTTRSTSFDRPSPRARRAVYRERLALDHAQRLYGNITDLTSIPTSAEWTTASSPPWRRAATSSTSRRRRSSSVTTVDLVNPDRGLYGPRRTRRSTPISTTSRWRSRTGSS